MYHSCFFFNDTATTEIYTLALHDALPIFFQNYESRPPRPRLRRRRPQHYRRARKPSRNAFRSEEHTSELQSRQFLVCRILLEKKRSNLSSFSPMALLTTQSYSGQSRNSYI